MELEFIVGKCLEKDREDRHQSAKEIAVDLRTLAEKLKSGRSTILRTPSMTTAVPAATTGAVVGAQAPPPDPAIVPRSRLRISQGVAAILGVALLGTLAMYFSQALPESSETPLRRFSFGSEGLQVGNISPDGKYIAYAAGIGGSRSLWLRSWETDTSRELQGTEGGTDVFWSPDNTSIGFRVGSELRRISIDGGNSFTLCALPAQANYLGGAWSPDGERIVFSVALRLYEVTARGGQPQLLFDPGESPRASSVLTSLPANGRRTTGPCLFGGSRSIRSLGGGFELRDRRAPRTRSRLGSGLLAGRLLDPWSSH